MDRRTLLALVLTAAVIVLVPMVFRTKAPPPAAIDSARTGATAATTARGARDSSTPVPTAATAPSSSPSAPATTASAARAIPAESTVVLNRALRYAVLSPGAAPQSVRLTGYQSRRRDEATHGAAELSSAAGPLLRYRLSLGARADTIALDTIPFRATRTGSDVTLTSASSPAITIQYRPGADGYVTRVSGEIAGDAAALAGARLLIDLPNGLRSQEADSIDDMNHLAYSLKPLREDVSSVSYGKLEPTIARTDSGPFQWVATRNKYFVVALLTDSGAAAPFAALRMVGAPKVGKVAPHATATATLPLSSGRFAFDLYTGPQSWPALHAAGRQFENVNPYGGWIPGVKSLTTICMRVLLWLRATLGVSYGWVLIIFGVAIRLLLWPLNQSAMRSSIKMQRLQPELMEIQKKYGRDPERLREESMKVYAAHGTSPFASIGGCLPMLLPMPVLLALFYVFQNTIEFRGVSFLWLPDLSLRDPFYITPLLMGLSMFLLSWIGMRSAPPNPQAKMMGFMMPVVMTVVLLNFPSGLNLYYAVQNIASLPQQWLISRERVKAGPPPAPAPVTRRRAAT